MPSDFLLLKTQTRKPQTDLSKCDFGVGERESLVIRSDYILWSAALIMHCSFCCFALTEEGQEEGAGRPHPREEEVAQGRSSSRFNASLAFSYIQLLFICHSVCAFTQCLYRVCISCTIGYVYQIIGFAWTESFQEPRATLWVLPLTLLNVSCQHSSTDAPYLKFECQCYDFKLF